MSKPETPEAHPAPAASAGMGEWLSRHWWTVFGSVIALFVLALVVLPVVFLLAGAVSVSGQALNFEFTLEHLRRVLGQSRTYGLLANSLMFSFGAMCVASAVSIPLAWFVERTNVPRKALLRLMVLCTIGMPGLLKALGWSLLGSPQIGLLNTVLPSFLAFDIYTMPGMILVQGLSFVPLMFLMISPAMRNVDISLEEAAVMSRARLPYVVRRILVALLRPSLLAACLYLFVVGLLAFDVPALLGVRAKIYVLSSEIFFSTTDFSVPQYGYASAISVFVMCIGLVAAVFYLWASRHGDRYITMSGRLRAGGLEIGRWRYLGYFWLCFYLLMSVVLPIGAVAWTSFLPFFTNLANTSLDMLTWSNYETIFGSSRNAQALTNSLAIATTTATSATILAALVSWFVVRSGVRWRRVLDLLAFMPLLVPGVAMGLGVRAAFLVMPFIPIYGTIWIIALANMIDSLPFGTRNLNGALVQIHPELEEAGVMGRAGHFLIFRRILFPLVLPTIGFVWLWIFLGALREFSIAVMLYSPSSQVASTLLYSYYDQADFTAAAAVGVLFFLFVFPLSLLVLWWLEWIRRRAGLL